MSTEQRNSPIEMELLETANDRFKQSFGSWFWGSISAAVVLHFAIFALFPTLSASDVSFTMEDIEMIDIPPEIEIPPPPEQIQRPANPVITDAQIDEDITIAPTTFESNLPDDLPPPRGDTGVDLSAGPTFTPYEVAPRVLNTPEIERALVREYPSMLRDAGIGGRVVMNFFIDENGVPQDWLVAESSGYNQLDQAAMRVAELFKFAPAQNRDQNVPVWIQLPITFNSR